MPVYRFGPSTYLVRRSQWPRDLRRISTAACPLTLWVRIPPETWMIVCCECCVLSGRGLCDGLITRPEESYRLWRVFVCDLETSKMRRIKLVTGLWKIQPKGCNAKKTNKQTYLVPSFSLSFRSVFFTETSTKYRPFLCHYYIFAQKIDITAVQLCTLRYYSD